MANISQMIMRDAIVTSTFGIARRIDSKSSLSSLKRCMSMKTRNDEKERTVRFHEGVAKKRRTDDALKQMRSSRFHGDESASTKPSVRHLMTISDAVTIMKAESKPAMM